MKEEELVELFWKAWLKKHNYEGDRERYIHPEMKKIRQAECKMYAKIVFENKI